MISTNATLTIRRIPLSQLQVVESVSCYPEKFAIYFSLLMDDPNVDVEPLIVTASNVYPGIYTIKNGKHRFCASIMAGRHDVLCLIEEEGQTDGRSHD